MDDDKNLELWNAVCTTDPNHTKQVDQRGGFTAIDAHYQVMMATKQFGPVGIGWGYVNGQPIFEQGFVLVPVTLWHGTRENTFGPVFGCAEMFGKRADADAPKKAGTDGLTKLLSQLGFNADVFLGKFDDSKYVEDLKRDKDKAAQTPEQKRDAIRKSIETATSLEKLQAFWSHPKMVEGVKTLPEPMQGELAKAVEIRTSYFAQEPEKQGEAA